MPRDLSFYQGLACRSGTPLYLFDREILLGNCDRFKNSLSSLGSKFHLAYPYKANPLSPLLEIIHQQGFWAEVSSLWEYELARSLGVRANEIVVNSPYKEEVLIENALKEGALLHLENWEEIETLKGIAKRGLPPHPSMGLRLRSNLAREGWQRFGFVKEEIPKALRAVLDSTGIRISSLHLHLGIGRSPKDFERGLRELTDLKHLLEIGNPAISIDTLDLGGGLPSDHLPLHRDRDHSNPPLEMYLDRILGQWAKTSQEENVHLILEPGRSLIASAGSLLTRVVAMKKNLKPPALILDAGTNALPTAFLFRHPILPLYSSSRKEAFQVYGPLCRGEDRIHPYVVLPLPRPGDLLLIQEAGAYSYSQACDFIRPRPKCVFSSEDSLPCPS